MKRYYFNIGNADNEIIAKMNTVANNLETAKQKIAFRLMVTYNNLAAFLHITFDYHEKIS